jgi:hypothetical protein
MLISVAPAMPSRAFATNALFPFVFEFALDFVFAEGFSSAFRLAEPELSDESLTALTWLGFWCAKLQSLPCLHSPLGKNLHGGGCA